MNAYALATFVVVVVTVCAQCPTDATASAPPGAENSCSCSCKTMSAGGAKGGKNGGGSSGCTESDHHEYFNNHPSIVKGFGKCEICVMVLKKLEGIAGDSVPVIVSKIKQACGKLPVPANWACKAVINILPVEAMAQALKNGLGADAACRSVGLC